MGSEVVLTAFTGAPAPSNGLGFVSKLNASGSALTYSTYLGGKDTDVAQGIAVDGAGSAYVMGQTSADDFPSVLPLQSGNNGGRMSS